MTSSIISDHEKALQHETYQLGTLCYIQAVKDRESIKSGQQAISKPTRAALQLFLSFQEI